MFLKAGLKTLKPGCRHHEAGDPSCKYLFAHLGPEGVNIGETYIGIILLAISLCMLCSCLIGMIKILNSILGTKVKSVIENAINADIQIHGLGWVTKYLAIMVSVLMITMAQSPSVINLHTMQTQHSKVYSALHYKSRTSITQYISPVLLDNMLQDDNSSLNKVCISRQIMSHLIIFHDSNEDDINLTMSSSGHQNHLYSWIICYKIPTASINLDITWSLLVYQHMDMVTLNPDWLDQSHYNPVQLDQSYFSPDQMRRSQSILFQSQLRTPSLVFTTEQDTLVTMLI